MITSNVVLYMFVASHAFVNNLFGNFPGSSESKNMFYEPSGVINIFCIYPSTSSSPDVCHARYGCIVLQSCNA